MEKSLIIDLATLPEEGKAYSGELDGAVFELQKGDAVSVGPMEYDLWIQRFESELLVTGSVSAPFEFTCARTLVPFKKTIRLENAAVSLEINESTEVDSSEALREELLLQFPSYPRCDEGDVPEPCEIESRYLAVDKPGADDLSIPPRSEGDDRWSALNDLTGLNDQT